MSEDTGGGFVQSLARGLTVVRAFDASHPELTLSEVARRTDLSRAAARRFLHTLVELGYVRTDGRHFALRPRVLELGYAYLSSSGLPQIAHPHLERLAAQVQESCSMAVLDGPDVVYVARVPTKRIMAVSVSVGTRFPAYATSMGRVLLAHSAPEDLDRYLQETEMRPLTSRTVTDRTQLRRILEQVRSEGYCLVDQELEEGLRSMAVPVRDARGAVVAAMNVSARAGRGDAEGAREELLPPLQQAADAVTADLVG